MSFACPEAAPKAALGIVLLLAGIALSGCEREERDYDPSKAEVSKLGPVPLVTLEPGGGRPTIPDGVAKDYEGNAYHVNQGQQLFTSFNCTGCHGNGGG